LQGPCFHYRDFPVNPCSSLIGIAVKLLDVRARLFGTLEYVKTLRSIRQPEMVEIFCFLKMF
jgi:hypothetical protein